jgi:hypothetical protein
MLAISSITFYLAIILLATTLTHSTPIDPDTNNSLLKRDRAPGAQCPSPLISTVAINTFEDNSAEFRICCPDSTPDGMHILDEVACCKHVTDAENPTGCTVADGTMVLPASVKGCDKGWGKKELKGITFCQKGK